MAGHAHRKGSRYHRYKFKVYAVNEVLELEEGAQQIDIEDAMEGINWKKKSMLADINVQQNNETNKEVDTNDRKRKY